MGCRRHPARVWRALMGGRIGIVCAQCGQPFGSWVSPDYDADAARAKQSRAAYGRLTGARRAFQ